MEKILFNGLTQQQKIETLDSLQKGGYVKVQWYSMPCTKKAFKDRVRKETTSVLRLGVNYGNLKENENKEINPLPTYLEWHYKNIILRNINTNGLLVRVYTSKVKNYTPSVQYYLDNEPITKQELIDMGALNASQSKSFDGNTFNIKLDNIISLG